MQGIDGTCRRLVLDVQSSAEIDEGGLYGGHFERKTAAPTTDDYGDGFVCAVRNISDERCETYLTTIELTK